MKKIIILVILVLILGLAYFVYQRQKSAPSPTSTSVNQNSTVTEYKTVSAVDGQESKYALGVVTASNASTVTFNAGKDGVKTANFTSSTLWTKQSKDSKGLLKIVSGASSDLHIGGHIIIYYSGNTNGTSYQADKIQIVD